MVETIGNPGFFIWSHYHTNWLSSRVIKKLSVQNLGMMSCWLDASIGGGAAINNCRPWRGHFNWSRRCYECRIWESDRSCHVHSCCECPKFARSPRHRDRKDARLGLFGLCDYHVLPWLEFYFEVLEGVAIIWRSHLNKDIKERW